MLSEQLYRAYLGSFLIQLFGERDAHFDSETAERVTANAVAAVGGL
jgi:hypothetical protein